MWRKRKIRDRRRHDSGQTERFYRTSPSPLSFSLFLYIYIYIYAVSLFLQRPRCDVISMRFTPPRIILARCKLCSDYNNYLRARESHLC